MLYRDSQKKKREGRNDWAADITDRYDEGGVHLFWSQARNLETAGAFPGARPAALPLADRELGRRRVHPSTLFPGHVSGAAPT